MNIQPRFWHTRFQLIVLIGLLLAVAWLEPASLEYQLVAAGFGGLGWIWIGSLLCLLSLAMLDIVVNDFTGRPLLKLLRRKRFLVFALIGVVLSALGAVAFKSRGVTAFMFIHFALTFFAFHIAVVDLFLKHQEKSN